MSHVRATIRLQFHKGFTLDDAVPLVPYFAQLGISHVYASPLLMARPGSMHGYDVVDPTRINPELGGEAALERLVNQLHQHDMGLILDIVSNHMAVGGSANPWWQDVMEWGPSSPYAEFFDIEWESNDPLMHQQLLVPFLRTDYGEVLASGEITLDFDALSGIFHASHFEHHFPICPITCAEILRAGGDHMLSCLARKYEELSTLPSPWERARDLRQNMIEQSTNAEMRDAIAQAVARFNDPSEAGRDLLHQLLEKQHYRLASWRTAADEINWRRFFDINELAGLRVETPRVFEACHAKIFELVEMGWVNGLRIDHVDGLANPRAYCRKLRRRVNGLLHRRPARLRDSGFPIYVEKIIGDGEQLPTDWGVNGTTGYEFMNQVSLLQHSPEGETALTEVWAQISGRPTDFMEEVYEARKLVLASSLASDLETVANGLLHIARLNLETRDYPLGAIRRALTELIAHFPVYRTYTVGCTRSEADAVFFNQALEGARVTLPDSDWPVLEQLDRWLGAETLADLPPGEERTARRRTLARFQQLTSPAAAKAVEDTACYRAGVLLSRYDVGFDPQHLSASVADFHHRCQQRRQTFPENLLTTATHDNKRGEDTRARLAVLSERAEWFIGLLAYWRQLAEPLRQDLEDGVAPEPGDEVILYQCLLGSWPLDMMEADDPDPRLLDEFLQRLLRWQEKALREAKLRSSWAAPNAAYEESCRHFLSAVLTSAETGTLRRSLLSASASIAAAGALNALVQAVLRMTVPGVPDLYQGTEYWDFALVDPDNRRPVDFSSRMTALQQSDPLSSLLQHWQDGRIKQAVIRKVLSARHSHERVFRDGSYLPLQLSGSQADRILAFARILENASERTCVIVIVPIRVAAMLVDAQIPLVDADAWEDTRVHLPEDWIAAAFTCLFSDRQISPHVSNPQSDGFSIREILADLPVSLLLSTIASQEYR